MKYTVTPTIEDLALGTKITIPGSAVRNHTGSWRSNRPEPELELCVRCGLCSIYCPEGCVAFDGVGYPDVNMDYCKGCGICARECVTSCITMVPQED